VPKTLVLASVLATLAVGASRADSNWIADPLTPSSFGVGANWDTGGQPIVPSTTDIAFIANGGTATVADGDIFTILGLQIDSGALTQTGGTLDSSASTTGTIFNVGTAAATGSLTASGNSTLNLGTARIGQNGGTGTVSLSGFASYIGVNNGDTWLGDQVGSTGTLNMQDDSKWIIGNNALVVGRGGGAGNLNMSGSSIITQAGNNTYLGGDQAGTIATVNMSGDSSLTNTAGEIWLGQNGSTATFNLSGNAKIEATNNWMAIGRAGASGTVTLSDSAQLLKSAGGGNLQLASGGGTAVLNAEDTSHVMTNNSIYIGDGGTGTFNVRDSAVVDVGSEIWIGQNTGAVGVMNLESGTVTLNNWLAVGRENSSGTLNIFGGTLIKNGGGNITTSALGAAPTSVINQTGGAIVVNSGEVWIHESGTSTSDWTATGGTGTFGAAINIHQGAGGTSSLTVGGTAVYTAPVIRNKTNGTLNVSGTGSLTVADTYFASGGTTNFSGGTFSVPQIIVDNGTNVMTFTGGTQNIGKIQINSGTILDTVTGYAIKAGQTILGTGNGTSLIIRQMSTTDGTSTVTMADGATNSLAQLTFQGGLVMANGGGLEFDVNGTTVRNDRMFAPDLTLGNNVSIKLNNLHLGSMVENTYYTLTLMTGGLDDGSWLNGATFNFVTDGTIAIDTSFGVNGVLVNTDSRLLQVKIASVQAVPEPSTYAMLALGLPGAMLVLRRKRA
jgi:hypothetical protein